MRIDVGLAIRDLGIKDFVLYGNPVDETEFLRMFKKIIGKDQNKHAIVSHNPNEFEVTWQQIEAKIAELQAAEPLRLLREKRNQLLAATDWMAVSDRTITQAQIDYRQALRDLPETADPQLDEQGNLTNVTWPTYE
jgi:YesN/AraC family two-component response regulator